MAKRVLVVDDEKLIVKGIRFSLEHEDFEVECAYDGEEALEKVKEKPFDIILLDVMLPKLTGFEVCQQIREFSDVPIIMLTAKGDDMDKILGLEYGADDYITKPFNILEVKARIKAIIRRSGRSGQKKDENKNEQIQTENEAVRLDKDGRRAFIEGREVSLTAKEFELLEFLMNHPNKIYSRDKLLHEVWGADYPGDVRTVDVHIRRMREKIETNPSEPKYLHTKWVNSDSTSSVESLEKKADEITRLQRIVPLASSSETRCATAFERYVFIKIVEKTTRGRMPTSKSTQKLCVRRLLIHLNLFFNVKVITDSPFSM